MCFSAEVSFSASVVLSSVGIASLAKSKSKEQTLFAFIPLLFGFQQFFEGCLWIALESSGHLMLEVISTYGFLIFAQLIWPVWVPLATYVMEPNKKKKKVILFFTATGFFLFLLLGYRMVVYNVVAEIDEQHIFYTVGAFKSTNWWSGIFYLLPAVFPFILSSIQKVKILGLVMLLLFVVAKVFYIKYMISVWCLFAAVISIYIYFILRQRRVVDLQN